ncbi:MAG: hypothetical protein ACRD50_07700 [Candidatus Acidiferrales bacterium]
MNLPRVSAVRSARIIFCVGCPIVRTALRTKRGEFDSLHDLAGIFPRERSIVRRAGKIILCLVALCAAAFLSTASARAQSAPLVAEKGKFHILLGGQELGKEDFEISRDGDFWVARGETTVPDENGQAIKVKGTLRLKADGSPAHYEWSTHGPKNASSTVEFEGQTVNVQLNVEGASRPVVNKFVFNAGAIVVLDNNMFNQYAILARLYDWTKKGSQTFSVLIPQEMTPGSITVESLGPQMSGNDKLETLRVKTEDAEIFLYVDDSHRLVKISVPSSNAEVTRE